MFGALFLLACILCFINDFGFLFAYRPFVVESIGMQTSLAACLLDPCAVLLIEMFQTRNRLVLIGHALAWLLAAVCVHATFFGITFIL